jgi:carbon-monoxide dehydrogenase small subunit
LEFDPIIMKLRRAFSIEHGLQCGFCTPGMLVVARDIIIRFPNANEQKVRHELSGNLCRCTGYSGIVRAILRASRECDAADRPAQHERELIFAPVGARSAKEAGQASPATMKSESQQISSSSAVAQTFGLGGKKPNIQMKQSFSVGESRDEVWNFLQDIESVITCLPGARLSGPPVDNLVHGQFSAKLGPITASFSGDAKIERNDQTFSGVILGAGQDRRAGSRAMGEVAYALSEEGGTRTRVDLEIRALLAGPLAQFGRSGIVDDLAKRIIASFAKNLELKLSGHGGEEMQKSFEAGSLVQDLILDRVRRILGSIFNLFRRG